MPIILTVKLATQLDQIRGNFLLEQKICRCTVTSEATFWRESAGRRARLGNRHSGCFLVLISPLTWLSVKRSKTAEGGHRKQNSGRVGMLRVNIRREGGKTGRVGLGPTSLVIWHQNITNVRKSL